MRTRRGMAVALATLTIGCGIPEEQHQKTLDEVKALKAEMASEQQSCAQDKRLLEEKNSAMGDENLALKAKLTSMGQDVSKLQTQAGQMVANLSEKEQMIADLMKAQEAARKRAAVYQNLVNKFQKMISSGKLKVSVRKGRMIVQMSDKILFDPGKAKLKKEGSEALLEVTVVLAGIAERQFQVAGHTDNIPIKTRRFKSNWELSTARAVNVVKFMAKNGMDPSRLSAAGYGPFDPVGDNSKDEGRQLNRRIEITLMPQLDEMPGIATSKSAAR